MATATFTFDSFDKTVWLDAPDGSGARAGELCERHVRVLTPPQGWHLEDRRVAVPDAATVRREEIVIENSIADQARANTVSDLRRVLDARTPLLSRAFQAAGTV